MPPEIPSATASGSVLFAREVGGFRLTEARFPAGGRVVWHRHRHPHFCLVLDGGYEEFSGRGGRACRAPDVLYHPAGHEHHDRISPAGARDLCVEVLPDGADRLGGDARLPRGPAAFRGGPAVWCAERLCREVRAWDAFSPLAVEGLVLELLAVTGRAQARPVAREPGWLREVRRAIDDGPAEKTSLAALAKRAGVHRATWPGRSGPTTGARSGSTPAGGGWTGRGPSSPTRPGRSPRSRPAPGSTTKPTSRPRSAGRSASPPGRTRRGRR